MMVVVVEGIETVEGVEEVTGEEVGVDPGCQP